MGTGKLWHKIIATGGNNMICNRFKGLSLFQVLISHGADVNAGLAERSPLHYAVLSDAPEVVRELLDAGACPDTPQVRSVYIGCQETLLCFF